MQTFSPVVMLPGRPVPGLTIIVYLTMEMHVFFLHTVFITAVHAYLEVTLQTLNTFPTAEEGKPFYWAILQLYFLAVELPFLWISSLTLFKASS